MFVFSCRLGDWGLVKFMVLTGLIVLSSAVEAVRLVKIVGLAEEPDLCRVVVPMEFDGREPPSALR